jgi:hypothetical protein
MAGIGAKVQALQNPPRQKTFDFLIEGRGVLSLSISYGD